MGMVLSAKGMHGDRHDKTKPFDPHMPANGDSKM